MFRVRKRSAAQLVILALCVTWVACYDTSITRPPENSVTPNLSTSTATGVIASGYVVNVRSGPGTSYSVVGTLTGGTVVTIVCTAPGTTHTGPWGTTSLWDRLSSGGWVSDAYVYTGSNRAVTPDCAAQGTPQQSSIRGDDYPYRNDPLVFRANECHADAWAFCKRNCTSFVAHRLNQDGVRFTNTYGQGRNERWSNGANWNDAALRARNVTVRVNRTPAVGAVAQWEATGSSPYGHVAYVAAVHNDGTITIEEYNFRNDGRYLSPTRRISASGVSNFIHFR